ncbi:RIO-type serine/threonine-protein kinase Rio1 [Candidatus Tiddalikarchaeum anstoanum]|nr:RIO-type serine/threonine-protein kinase Rio1 [Candidatus Tiddalikarchaeum anstoanum]
MVERDFRVRNEVFDESTIRVLDKFRHEYFEDLEHCISTGKEANIFRATTKDGFVAVKIFRTYTTSFERMAKYIEGDPRFARVKKSRHSLVYLWCRKEFKNLSKAASIGINVPKVYVFRKNVLVMELIGENGCPAPMLKDVTLDNYQEWYDEIIAIMVKLYKGDLVHADLSEFNILVFKSRPVIIDMAQSVLVEHPEALNFLKKDLYNVNAYFLKKKCKIKSWEEFKKLIF